MRNRKALVPALILLGLSAGTHPARADQADVARAEKELQSYAGDKDLTGRYANHLYYLAGLYRNNGMRQKSDQAFAKFLELWRKKPQAESEAKLMLGWATSMIPERHEFSYPNGTSEEQMERDQERDRVEHKQDLIKAAKIADDALVMASKMPDSHAEKIEILFEAASVYKGTGNEAKRQRVIAQINRAFKAMEQNTRLAPQQIRQLADHLIQLSDIYSPMLDWRQTMTMQPVKIVPNLREDDTRLISQHDFTTGEHYRLRAMAQYDRLPARDPYRINAQRSFVAWCRLYGQNQQYKAQLQKLGNLLGSMDEKVLFPAPRYCPGCGRG